MTRKLFFVEDVHYPLELSALNARNVNLDELNFLARRLDSFTDDEIEQFYAAVEQRNAKSLKDMINLTYNLDKFTIIKDVGNMTKVGREYTLNTEGCANADSRYILYVPSAAGNTASYESRATAGIRSPQPVSL